MDSKNVVMVSNKIINVTARETDKHLASKQEPTNLMRLEVNPTTFTVPTEQKPTNPVHHQNVINVVSSILEPRDDRQEDTYKLVKEPNGVNDSQIEELDNYLICGEPDFVPISIQDQVSVGLSVNRITGITDDSFPDCSASKTAPNRRLMPIPPKTEDAESRDYPHISQDRKTNLAISHKPKEHRVSLPSFQDTYAAGEVKGKREYGRISGQSLNVRLRGSGKMKAKRRRVITQDQRKAANVRERRRMLNLNDAFDRLRKAVPTFSYEKKLSRIETLRLAILYIYFMAELMAGKRPEQINIRLLSAPLKDDDRGAPW